MFTKYELRAGEKSRREERSKRQDAMNLGRPRLRSSNEELPNIAMFGLVDLIEKH